MLNVGVSYLNRFLPLPKSRVEFDSSLDFPEIDDSAIFAGNKSGASVLITLRAAGIDERTHYGALLRNNSGRVEIVGESMPFPHLSTSALPRFTISCRSFFDEAGHISAENLFRLFDFS